MKKKILVIEDETEIRTLVKNRLVSWGFDVVTAVDGEDGFSKFMEEKPDLVILDLMLPKYNGHEVCRKIRREQNNNTPILMLTAKDQEADRIIGRVQGADQYLVKPYDPKDLLERINLLLEK